MSEHSQGQTPAEVRLIPSFEEVGADLLRIS